MTNRSLDTVVQDHLAVQAKLARLALAGWWVLIAFLVMLNVGVIRFVVRMWLSIE